MDEIRSIAELPFAERSLLTLLHLDEQRDSPDLDFAGYGYGRADSLWLARHDHPELVQVKDALILALHSADEGEVLAGDVELEFEVEAVAPGYSVTVLLSDFMRIWLSRIGGAERAIVLALCNPHRAVLPRPASSGSTPLYYAIGNVDSWGDWDEDGGQSLTLVADDWRVAE